MPCGPFRRDKSKPHCGDGDDFLSRFGEPSTVPPLRLLKTARLVEFSWRRSWETCGDTPRDFRKLEAILQERFRRGTTGAVE